MIIDDIDSDIVIFFSDGVDLVTIDLNNINLDDDDFNEYDPETILHDVKQLLARQDTYKQRKACKKYKRRINAYKMTSNKSVGLV